MRLRTATSSRQEILAINESIRYRSGRKIDWLNPPKASTIVRWRHQGRSYKCSFRTACAMARLNRLTEWVYGVSLEIFQPCFNTTVAASEGTHDYDAVWDLRIPGVAWREQERFLRSKGFACWYRGHPFVQHIHGFVLPRSGDPANPSRDFALAGIKVGKYVDGGFSLYGQKVTSSQIADYYAEAFGLSGAHEPGSDHSWFPDNKAATAFRLDVFIEWRRRDMMIAKAV